MQSRLIQFDILKSILIISVVIGHVLTNDNDMKTIIFWFHMPVFFMISGFFLKNVSDINTFKTREYYIDKIKKYVVPFFSYCVVCYIIFPDENILKHIARILYAGNHNVVSATYPYWFINVLFLALITYNYISCRCSVVCKMMIISLLYVVTYFIFKFVKFNLPWGVELIGIAMVYLFIGDLFKKYSFRKWHLAVLVIPIIFTWINFNYSLDYHFNMAGKGLDNLFLNLFIPCIFALSLYFVSIGIGYIPIIKQIMSKIGECSLTIFFTHAAVIAIFKDYDITCRVLIAMVIGVILHYIFYQFNITQFAFLGKKPFN